MKANTMHWTHHNHLVDVMDACALSQCQMYWHLDVGLKKYSLQALQQQAYGLAKKLCAAGLTGRVGLIGNMSPDFVLMFLACQYAKLTPVVLPTPRLNLDRWQKNIAKMLVEAKTSQLLVKSQAEQQFIPGIENIVIDCLVERDTIQLPIMVNEEAYIQFSSGSTSEPKGIVISQTALLHNIQNILRYGLNIQKDDKAISWLPFYHDMGLVGFLLAPLVCRCEMHFLPSKQFLRRPVKWLELISEYQLSISYAPSFAYQRLVDMTMDDQDLDLSSWRIAGIGAEKIQSQTLHDFYQAFKQYGFKQEAFWPSYGMAESTLAISMQHPQDTKSWYDKNKNTIMASGRVLPDTDIQIIPDDVDQLVGEIWVKSPSMATHYANGDLIAKENGYFATGDVGYIEDNNLVVVGRKKESILIHGQNIWPQDVESLLNTILPKGIVVLAFGLEQEHKEQLCILFAKNHWQPEQVLKVQDICRSGVFANFGIVVSDDNMLFSTNKAILTTSSGKLARLAVKKMYCQRQLVLIDSSQVGETDYAAT